MVAMGVDEDEERRMDERPMHQGCMAGFLHLFDRPQILSGRRLHSSQRRLTSVSSVRARSRPCQALPQGYPVLVLTIVLSFFFPCLCVQGSATPSERSMPLDRAPSSPDTTPPAAPRPSLQLSPLDLKEGGVGGGFGAPQAWRLPRLSLDSRAVVDARGKLRPREIRTSAAAGAPPSPSAGCADERRSPSVVARLMGLDALPHGLGQASAESGQHGGGGASPAALRRSASERVPRDPAQFRFVDPSFFERPASPLPSPPVAEEVAVRRAPDPAAVPRALQRRSRFDAHYEVFPEPAKRADPASGAAAHGEIALYGEIERRLRKRGIAEPARDLETLKQILEALQLKGLLHHTAPVPAQARTTPPPIVVMRPSSRAQPQMPPPARLTPARRLRVDVDRARRPRSPDPSPSPARSPASPARRGSLSPQRRVSPSQSPKQQQQSSFRKTSGFDSAGARTRIARRAAYNGIALSPDDEASTTFSDGGSSSSASSRWDFDTVSLPHLHDRSCYVLTHFPERRMSDSLLSGPLRDAAAGPQDRPRPARAVREAAEQHPRVHPRRRVGCGPAAKPRVRARRGGLPRGRGLAVGVVGVEASDRLPQQQRRTPKAGVRGVRPSA
jgi:hypothetical protein